MKYTYHIINKQNEIEQTYYTHSNIDDCMNELMSHLFNILGNGDGENGGKGSLWRCANEIYDTIKSGKVYCYADCKFWLETDEDDDEDDDEKENEYVFKMSAVVDNVLHLYAKNIEEAKKEYEFCKKDFIEDLKEYVSKTSTGWEYDGNIRDEECEEIPS